MISPREILLAFLLPALVCVLLGALAARVREGWPRRSLQACAMALSYGLASFAIAGYIPLLTPLSSATDLVPLLALAVALLAALLTPDQFLWRALPLVLATGLLVCFFNRLASPPAWPERGVALLALVAAWSLSREGSAGRPVWRPLLALGTFAGAVALACICGRVASLALVAGGLGVSIGACFLVCLRWPGWSFARPGLDVGVFALGGTLVCAVYLGELAPLAALALLAALAASRLPRFTHAFGAQLALTGLGLWLAWPADGLVS